MATSLMRFIYTPWLPATNVYSSFGCIWLLHPTLLEADSQQVLQGECYKTAADLISRFKMYNCRKPMPTVDPEYGSWLMGVEPDVLFLF